VSLLGDRYPESEAARFVAGWSAALGEGPATAPVLPAPVPVPAAPDSLAASADSLAASAGSPAASAAAIVDSLPPAAALSDSALTPPASAPEGSDEP